MGACYPGPHVCAGRDGDDVNVEDVDFGSSWQLCDPVLVLLLGKLGCFSTAVFL